MGKHYFKKLAVATVALATLGATMSLSSGTVMAAKGDHGVDWSRYQGANGIFGYPDDKFAVIQMGGTTTGWNLYDQWTYGSQVRSAIAQGKRAHNYIWWQNVTTIQQADQVLNYFLPKVQTPKGSIIALDVESGYQNTQAIDHACQRIKDAGYTPMVYGYKNFLVNNTDLHYLASKYQLWLAEYPNYSVTREPNYNFFPSFENIGMFQYTSTAIAGGLDRNIDLTGITDNGYTNGNAQKPKTETPATEQGKQLHQDTHNYTVKSGDSWWKIANDHGMDMYALAKLNGSTINSVIYPGQVLRVADKGEGNSVSNKVQKPVPNANNNNQQASTYTVRYGDSWWKIANDHGMNMYTLAQINGKSIYSTIYPGQVLKISVNTQVQQRKSYTVRYGDNLSTIAYRLGTSVNHLVATNGLRNANLIYPGQVLSY